MSDTFERKVITPAEREARKVFKEADAAKAMTEHERAQKAFQANRERLRALRLAREADDAKAK
jgi:cell division septum initiation protein DivIVA